MKNIMLLMCVVSLLFTFKLLACECDSDCSGDQHCEKCTPPGGETPETGVCCGPGSWEWVTDVDRGDADEGYTTPDFIIENGFGIDTGEWDGEDDASYDNSSCSAEASGDGHDSWSIFDYSWSGVARADAWYEYKRTNEWDGAGPACPRALDIDSVGGGGGGQDVSATCGAHKNDAVSADTSGSGSISSKGVSISMSMESLSANASYDDADEEIDVSGNVGGAVTDNSANVEGSYSEDTSFSKTGTGAETGNASYSIVSTDGYEGCSSSSYSKRRYGTCRANGSATWGSPGSAAFVASADVNVTY